MKKERIAILASGTGSNAKALMEYFSTASTIKIACLISNNESCGALEAAREQNVPLKLYSNDEIEQGDVLTNYLSENKIDFIILAGFLRKIPATTIRNYPNKIINIHPALLPAFGGKGMYGQHVHKAVLESKSVQSGITIHCVNENYDEGNYVAQFYTYVLPNDTIKTLENRIRALELRYYPIVVEGYIHSITN